MRILHFAPDDKFLPFLQGTFETVYPGCNAYRIEKAPGSNFEFALTDSNVKAVDKRYWTSEELDSDLKASDCLVINFMLEAYTHAVKIAPKDLFIVWMGWVADYYRFIEPFMGSFLLSKTNQFIKYHGHTIQHYLKQGVKYPSRILPHVSRRIGFHSKEAFSMIPEIVPRLDLVTILDEEIELFEKAFPSYCKKYHRLRLYSAEQTFAVGPSRMNGPDLLIGNSATPTNNHLELFDLLSKFDLDGRHLIVPLNYGDMWYGDAIARMGQKRFGSGFVPLRNFLPLKEYYGYIARCGTVFMNHIRQQAGTTIATALYKGAKVYLRNENPVFRFYRKIGLPIRSIQDDLLRRTDIFGPLGEEDTKLNQVILTDYWGHEAALNAIRELEEMVKNKRSGHVD